MHCYETSRRLHYCRQAPPSEGSLVLNVSDVMTRVPAIVTTTPEESITLCLEVSLLGGVTRTNDDSLRVSTCSSTAACPHLRLLCRPLQKLVSNRITGMPVLDEAGKVSWRSIPGSVPAQALVIASVCPRCGRTWLGVMIAHKVCGSRPCQWRLCISCTGF